MRPRVHLTRAPRSSTHAVTNRQRIAILHLTIDKLLFSDRYLMLTYPEFALLIDSTLFVYCETFSGGGAFLPQRRALRLMLLSGGRGVFAGRGV